jgi:hypothetical protein
MAKLACLNFLTRYKAQNSNYQILLNLVNVNTKYAYVVALKDKTQDTVLNALERIRQRSTIDGRPLKVLKIDNGKEFTNNKITNWLSRHQKITILREDDKKCLKVGERFNRVSQNIDNSLRQKQLGIFRVDK